MKKINLSGKHKLQAIVDNDDYEYLSFFDWYAIETNGKFYAVRSEKRSIIFMHRVIMKTPEKLVVDHKDGNGLNNQKSNIRNCTIQQNCMNRSLRSDSKTGYKGVSKTKRGWKARVFHGKKTIYNKTFNNIEDAIKAYKEAAKKAFGDFAKEDSAMNL